MPDYFCANCDKVFSSPREGGSVPVCDCGKAARKLLSPGEELGGCRIGKHLSGKGAVSFYLAEQTAIRRPVLLKVLDSSLPEGEALLHKFLEEARNSVKFPHPNIISVLNAGRRGPLHFCVFPDIPGKELSGILEEGKIYSPEEALSLLRGIAEALQSLWLKQKTAHGCLAPCDFLLSPDGDLFLRNFWDRPETVPELEARGEEERLAYLAPERANGAPPDESSDLYSFGAILYRMTTGKRPFQGASPEEIRQALSAKESFLARAPEQDLPRSPAFRKFLARLCAAERENRFPDWGAFFEETHLLKAALLQEEVSPRGGAEVRAGSPAAVPVPRKIPLREEGKKAEPSSPPQAPSGTAQELSRPKRNTFGIVLRLLFLLFAVLALTALGIYLPRREEIRRSNALIAEAEKAWNDDLPKFPDKYHAARNHAKEKKVSLFTGTKLKGLDKKFDLLRPELVRAAEFREKYRVAYGNFLRKVSPLGVDIQWTRESCVLHPHYFRISRFLREQEYLANDLAAMETIFRGAEEGSLLKRLLSAEEKRLKLLTDAFGKFRETYGSEELARSLDEYRARYGAVHRKFVLHRNLCGLDVVGTKNALAATPRFSDGAFLFFEDKLQKDLDEMKAVLDEAGRKDPRLKELFSDAAGKPLSLLTDSFAALRKKFSGQTNDPGKLLRKWTAASGYFQMLLHRSGVRVHYPRHALTANDSFRKEEFAKNRGEMEECLRTMEKTLAQTGEVKGAERGKALSARHRTKMLRTEFGKFCSSVDEGVIPRTVPEGAPETSSRNLPKMGSKGVSFEERAIRSSVAAQPSSGGEKAPSRVSSPALEDALKRYRTSQEQRWKLCCMLFLNLSLPGRASTHTNFDLQKMFTAPGLPEMLKNSEEALSLYRKGQKNFGSLRQLFREANSFYSRLASSGTLCRNCTVCVDGTSDKVESIQDQYVTTHQKKKLRLPALGRHNLVRLSRWGAERDDALKKEHFAFLLKLCAFREAEKAAEGKEEKELAEELKKLYPGEIRNPSHLLLLEADLKHLPREERTSALREEYRLLQEAVKKRNIRARRTRPPSPGNGNQKRRQSR